jgi:hypothetical protein
MTTIHTLNDALREYNIHLYEWIYEAIHMDEWEGETTADEWREAYNDMMEDIHHGFIDRIDDPKELVEEYGVWAALGLYTNYHDSGYLLGLEEEPFYQDLLFAILDWKDDGDDYADSPTYEGFIAFCETKGKGQRKEGEQ